MGAVTICSDFGAQENKVSHCFHFFPIYLPWSDGTRYHDLSFLSSLPDCSIYGISQARILEWVAISFYGESSQPRD